MSDKTILLITCIFFLLLAGTPAVLSSPNEGVTTWGKSYDEIFAIPDYKPMFNRSWDDLFRG